MDFLVCTQRVSVLAAPSRDALELCSLRLGDVVTAFERLPAGEESPKGASDWIRLPKDATFMRDDKRKKMKLTEDGFIALEDAFGTPQLRPRSGEDATGGPLTSRSAEAVICGAVNSELAAKLANRRDRVDGPGSARWLYMDPNNPKADAVVPHDIPAELRPVLTQLLIRISTCEVELKRVVQGSKKLEEGVLSSREGTSTRLAEFAKRVSDLEEGGGSRRAQHEDLPGQLKALQRELNDNARDVKELREQLRCLRDAGPKPNTESEMARLQRSVSEQLEREASKIQSDIRGEVDGLRLAHDELGKNLTELRTGNTAFIESLPAEREHLRACLQEQVKGEVEALAPKLSEDLLKSALEALDFKLGKELMEMRGQCQREIESLQKVASPGSQGLQSALGELSTMTEGNDSEIMVDLEMLERIQNKHTCDMEALRDRCIGELGLLRGEQAKFWDAVQNLVNSKMEAVQRTGAQHSSDLELLRSHQKVQVEALRSEQDSFQDRVRVEAQCQIQSSVELLGSQLKRNLESVESKLGRDFAELRSHSGSEMEAIRSKQESLSEVARGARGDAGKVLYEVERLQALVNKHGDDVAGVSNDVGILRGRQTGFSSELELARAELAKLRREGDAYPLKVQAELERLSRWVSQHTSDVDLHRARLNSEVEALKCNQSSLQDGQAKLQRDTEASTTEAERALADLVQVHKVLDRHNEQVEQLQSLHLEHLQALQHRRSDGVMTGAVQEAIEAIQHKVAQVSQAVEQQGGILWTLALDHSNQTRPAGSSRQNSSETTAEGLEATHALLTKEIDARCSDFYKKLAATREMLQCDIEAVQRQLTAAVETRLSPGDNEERWGAVTVWEAVDRAKAQVVGAVEGRLSRFASDLQELRSTHDASRSLNSSMQWSQSHQSDTIRAQWHLIDEFRLQLQADMEEMRQQVASDLQATRQELSDQVDSVQKSLLRRPAGGRNDVIHQQTELGLIARPLIV